MQIAGSLLGLLVSGIIYGVVAWVLWNFYRALVRISTEIRELRTVLQDRLPQPGRPEA
ncbi:MAG TPA: hypothetical protein VLX58_13860 [Bryobacteraceae bacterium]|nr:hypothetical protein [Bryobacteraceae bacterium]